MPNLDDLLHEAQERLAKDGHGQEANAVGAARKELKRLMLPPMDDGLAHLEVGTLLSSRTKQGMVELVLNREKTQMDLDKAREVLGMLSGAIEAAVSDTLLFAFLTTKVGLAPDQAAAALVDFRELRQGSRSTVYPS